MVTLAILGAGNRGTVYADYALRHPDKLKVVAIAEPRPDALARLAKHHPEAETFTSWRKLASRERLADAVAVALPDAEHAQPAINLVDKGYHLLLEKPMAPTEQECRDIVGAVERAGVLMAVGHVLRYTPYTAALKKLLAEGAVGELVSLQRLEPVGYWHQAHSYVRGNWRNAETSSFMLLAKACHDLDWIRYVMAEPCSKVSSFGNLYHFKKEHKPAAAGEAVRCTECAYEPDCPYSAERFYSGLLRAGKTGMPLSAVTLDLTEAGVRRALAGPYGRCVYECDNNVVDHQVVNMVFASGKTAALTMTAFNVPRPRSTHLFGTRGEIYGDGRTLAVTDFLSEQTVFVDTHAHADPLSIVEGHGGGDEGLVDAFVEAVRTGNGNTLLSGPAESLESHLMAFAAETARLEERVVRVHR